jgi:hypothetical protein
MKETINKQTFEQWLACVKKEQNHYPYLKGKKLNERALKSYYESGYTPVSALNDLLTLV